MKTIYKYRLLMHDEQLVAMPEGAQLLSVINQKEELMLYALVDTDLALVTRVIYVHGTGHPCRHNQAEHKFIGTASFVNGELILHVFSAS